MKPSRIAVSAVLAFAILGALFAGTSTYDFVAHLDRQVHAISCSYVPGAGAADASGTSGCFAVMMSPYAAVWRSTTWGGIPIALPGLAVFFYLAFKAVELLWRRREEDRSETTYLMAATALPLVVSIIYFIVSVTLVGVVCKLCVGIYVASLGGFIAAVVAHRGSAPDATALPWRRYAYQFASGVAVVVIPTLLYAGIKPDVREQIARCGKLLRPQDTYATRVKLQSVPDGTPTIEVIDPLCPACKAVRDRLEASGLLAGLDLEAALFPLDRECNWMINESVHPGACAISEAILCAGPRAHEVVGWAFARQNELREAAATDPAAVRAQVRQAFPDLAGCVDTPAVKARLNKALRWAVANSLPISTPQLYVRGNRVCEEDTDLGLEYALTQVIGPMAAATPQPLPAASRRPGVASPRPPAPVPEPDLAPAQPVDEPTPTAAPAAAADGEVTP